MDPKSNETKLNKSDSMSSVFVSDSEIDDFEINFKPGMESTDNELDHFLRGIQTPRYKHQVLFFNNCFDDEGTFELFTHATDLPIKDKSMVKKFYQQNIFNENFGQGVIRIADTRGISFLLQPTTFAIIEADKEVIREGYEEALHKLQQLEGKTLPDCVCDKPSQYEILFRYAIPLCMGWKCCVDFIYDRTASPKQVADKISLQLHYLNEQEVEYKFQSHDRNYFQETYHMMMSAEPFVEFLQYGPVVSILLTNATLTRAYPGVQDLPENHSGNGIGNHVKEKMYHNYTIQGYFQDGVQTIRMY